MSTARQRYFYISSEAYSITYEKPPSTRRCIALAVALGLCISVTAIAMEKRGASSQGVECPIIAMYFYVWYRNGFGSNHWNGSPTTIVVDKPLIGFYSSIDDNVVRWQLEKIRELGVDALFISWWGPGSYEDRAAQKVFSYLELYGLKAAILVEPFKP